MKHKSTQGSKGKLNNYVAEKQGFKMEHVSNVTIASLPKADSCK